MSDRDAYIKQLEDKLTCAVRGTGLPYVGLSILDFAVIINMLKETQQQPQTFFVDSDGKIMPLPAQKQGHWIDKGYGEYRCSECDDMLYFRDGSPSTEGYRYCPYCGARMKARMK